MSAAAEALSLAVAERTEALERRSRPLASAHQGELTIRAYRDHSDLWFTIARDEHRAGLVWRLAPFGSDPEVRRISDGHLMAFAVDTSLGRHRITLDAPSAELEELVVRHTFRAGRGLHVPYIPRDLTVARFAEGARHPLGRIEAKQRRLNTGLCYLEVVEPGFGKVLYVQDWSELADYFDATGTKPENAVGGEWPEVGYLAPTQPADPRKALPARREITLSHAHLIVRRFPESEEDASAWQFLDMLGAVYQRLDKPPTAWRDWVARSRRTLRDLQRSPDARTRHGDEIYLHPCTAAENPDSMVQLSLLSAIHEWGRWSGKRSPLEREALRGLAGFYDAKLRTLRRYLPDVAKDKDRGAVDNWYLYHPLMNLANLALDGDEVARDLFLKSIDYGIEAARHFRYRWPIQFKIDTFKVITAVAADDRGQTDVGGMYAWVMLQAFELTGEARFLEEAKAAIASAKGMRFDLNYQANLSAWGATACIRLWRITNDRHYLAQSYVYLATFFHNCQMWRSRIGQARHYNNFLAVTCLQDAPYMAIYECFDSFAAFERYLDLGGPDLIPAAKLLVFEYCRYALDRAWFYYPDALPKEALAPEKRNGHIDRKLSFPVEDLYPDGQPAGQVGQEIYGAGAAMVFATRAFHRIQGAPFVLHCDHFLRALTGVDERAVSFALDGPVGQDAAVRVLFARKTTAVVPVLKRIDGPNVASRQDEPGRAWCFAAPAQGAYLLSW